VNGKKTLKKTELEPASHDLSMHKEVIKLESAHVYFARKVAMGLYFGCTLVILIRFEYASSYARRVESHVIGTGI
jgi:hypothetical protein